jgi:hypothetical protein
VSANLYTEAQRLVTCPHCHVPAGARCRTKRGTAMTYPHERRAWALMHTPGYFTGTATERPVTITPRRTP